MTARERAEEMLSHYMGTAWRAAGLQWNGDNFTEIAIVFDGIEEMIRDAIDAHEERSPHRYADGSSS